MSIIEFQFGYGELEYKLKALNSIRLEAVAKKQPFKCITVPGTLVQQAEAHRLIRAS